MNMVQVLTQVEDAKMQVQAVSFPNRVAITYRSHSMGSSTLHLEACDPGARHKSPAVQISQKLSAAKEFRLRSFTWERQLMALSPTIISAQGSGCPASIWGWCPAISNLKWILGSLGIFWENSRFVTHIFQNRLQPPRPFSRFFSPFLQWVPSRISGTASLWTSAVPRMHGWMSAGRWPRRGGRDCMVDWKKNISPKNIALMTGTVVTIIVDPPTKVKSHS